MITYMLYIDIYDYIYAIYRHLGLQLSELERAIEGLMEADFVNYAMEDIKGRVTEFERLESPDGIDTEVSLIPIVHSLIPILIPIIHSLIPIVHSILCIQSHSYSSQSHSYSHCT